MTVIDLKRLLGSGYFNLKNVKEIGLGGDRRNKKKVKRQKDEHRRTGNQDNRWPVTRRAGDQEANSIGISNFEHRTSNVER